MLKMQLLIFSIGFPFIPHSAIYVIQYYNTTI
jgi:hypothetical protein